MTYRLNFYHGGKLAESELVEGPLEEAKSLATAATDSGQAHRAEILDRTGQIIFQRWAVL